MKVQLIVAAALGALCACSHEVSQPQGGGPAPGPSAAGTRVTIDQISVEVPADWRRLTATSPMRKAEFTLAGEGAGGDASLTVYTFGPAAGTVQANLERWQGQFKEEPAGNAKTTTAKTAGGRPITMIDVRGTYVAAVTPGAAERRNDPGFAMLAAVVELDSGAWYFKLLGPAATVAARRAEVVRMLESAQPAK